MPDRELTEEETAVLKAERMQKKPLLHAIEIVQNELTKPSLHDLYIIELDGYLAAQTLITIEQGQEIRSLKAQISALKELILEK